MSVPEPKLLRNARLLGLDPLAVTRADVRLRDGRIAEVGPALRSYDDEEQVELAGRAVLPGLVCAHTHLYSALARGMPGPAAAPVDFVDILEQIWWRLDRALDPESVRLSALVGAVDALRAGTTTLIDHHSSPACIEGSLGILRRALEQVGLRAVLCYEVTDRGGQAERDAGLQAHRELFAQQDGRCAALVGAHASFTLGPDSLRACAELAAEAGTGLHIHVAEDAADGRDCQTRYGQGLVERLAQAGALGPRSVLAHATQLSPAELERVRTSGSWIVHNPRSNMNNQVGYARVDAFGERTALGTDGIGADMLEELKHAFYKARDAGAGWSAEECVATLRNGHRLASQLLGVRLGVFEAGAEADLLLLDYDPPTPLHAGNLAWHLVFGISSLHVQSVLVGGAWRLQNRKPTGIDPAALAAEARGAAAALWKRMAALPASPQWRPKLCADADSPPRPENQESPR